jgi:hypothetical protein
MRTADYITLLANLLTDTAQAEFGLRADEPPTGPLTGRAHPLVPFSSVTPHSFARKSFGMPFACAVGGGMMLLAAPGCTGRQSCLSSASVARKGLCPFCGPAVSAGLRRDFR